MLGALRQCTNRDEIFKLVNDMGDAFCRLTEGPNASHVLANMLEYAAKDGDSLYVQKIGKKLCS